MRETGTPRCKRFDFSLRVRHDDSGASLVMVLALGLIGTLFAIAAMDFAVADQNLGARDRDWTSAIYSAEAGLNMYLWKMNDDPQYFLTDPALRSPSYFPGELSWTSVPEGQGDYRLKITPQPKIVGKELSVTIQASGRSRGVVRTLQVDMSRKSFLDWMYFTDYETYDGTNASCKFYGKKHSGSCGIRFADGDVLRGPLKSNDYIMLASCTGPTFESTLVSGRGTIYNGSGSNCATNTPNFQGTVTQCGLSTACPSQMPISNSQLLQDAQDNGYVYWGPVEITPTSSGNFKVYSKYGVNGVANTSAKARTLAAAPPTSTTTEYPPPPNGVIYVMDKTTAPTGVADVYIRGTTKGQWTVASATSIWLWDDLLYSDNSSTSKDVIGLISNKNVYVGDKRRTGASDSLRRPVDPEIHAAILALQGDIHAYGVQNPPDSTIVTGCSGTLHLVGALIQQTRGVVGLGGSGCPGGLSRGYLKLYEYDERLGYVQPPRFLEPTNSSWRELAWREAAPDPT